MLIDDKFIYLSLPRCASTSFFISCLRNNLNVRHSNSTQNENYNHIELSSTSNIDLVYQINHFHESIGSLKNSFGDGYEIISVKRNRHERFVSYFNHCIGELYRKNVMDLYSIFLELDVDDLLFYNTNDILGKSNIIRLIDIFLNRIGYKGDILSITPLLMPMFAPLSTYHNHNPNIIWFDFDDLTKLEDWVSVKTSKEFKLSLFGSSKEYQSKINVDEYFIEKYNKIYDYYDIVKKQNTLL
jgi:hypothetical protein